MSKPSSRSDLYSMIVHAIRYYPEHISDMSAHDLAAPEDVVARKVAWQLLTSERVHAVFHGVSMIRAVDGYLLPPPSHRYWTGPTADEMESAPFLESWSVILMPYERKPAKWQLGGGHWIFPGGDVERRWEDLISITTDRLWARCTGGWVHLGRRFHS